MNTRLARCAGWLLVGLAVWPLISAADPSPEAEQMPERLEWMLASHDVRYVLLAPRASSSECLDSEAERSR